MTWTEKEIKIGQKFGWGLVSARYIVEDSWDVFAKPIIHYYNTEEEAVKAAEGYFQDLSRYDLKEGRQIHAFRIEWTDDGEWVERESVWEHYADGLGIGERIYAA